MKWNFHSSKPFYNERTRDPKNPIDGKFSRDDTFARGFQGQRRSRWKLRSFRKHAFHDVGESRKSRDFRSRGSDTRECPRALLSFVVYVCHWYFVALGRDSRVSYVAIRDNLTTSARRKKPRLRLANVLLEKKIRWSSRLECLDSQTDVEAFSLWSENRSQRLKRY